MPTTSLHSIPFISTHHLHFTSLPLLYPSSPFPEYSPLLTMSFIHLYFYNTKIVFLNYRGHFNSCPFLTTSLHFNHLTHSLASPLSTMSVNNFYFFNTKIVILNNSNHLINSNQLPSLHPTSLFLYYFPSFLLCYCNTYLSAKTRL